MSRENVEIVRRGAVLYSAYLRDQSDDTPLDELIRDFAPDAEIDFSRILPDLPPARGPEAMRAWNKTIAGLFDELRLTHLRFTAVGDAVVAPVTVEGRGRGSGIAVEAAYTYVFRVAGGKVVSAVTYPTEAQAMAAVGVREAGPADEPFLEEMVRLAAGWRDDVPAPMTPDLEPYVRDFGRRPGDHGVLVEGLGAAWVRLLPGGYGFVAEDVPELAIAVAPGHRGAGLGGALLQHVLDEVGAVSLSVGADNPARALYERHGFVKVDERGPAWVMLRA